MRRRIIKIELLIIIIINQWAWEGDNIMSVVVRFQVERGFINQLRMQGGLLIRNVAIFLY